MSDIAIQVEGLAKQYRLGQSATYATLRESIMNAITGKAGGSDDSGTIWALDDISFDVKEGEVVGIIGRNGSGKSTLLKILSRITEPTRGQAAIYGRVGALLEVGTGFHPELTGRENIFLNGAILGMKRSEIKAKFDDIVAFAEIDKFIDTPVKRYSSEMYTRLAFAVAAHLEPEILVVDEVLAVGDARFQKKCLGKMQDVARGGHTVLFVSHQTAAIENFCSRAVLLGGGQLVMQGNTHDVISTYLRDVMPSALEGESLADRADRTGNGRVRLINFHITDNEGKRVTSFRSGGDAVIELGFECPGGETVRNVDIGLSVHNSYDQTLFVIYRSYRGELFDQLPVKGEFRCTIPNLPLYPGRYRIQARITANGDEADFLRGGVGYV